MQNHGAEDKPIAIPPVLGLPVSLLRVAQLPIKVRLLYGYLRFKFEQ
jgi:hypothetical protein